MLGHFKEQKYTFLYTYIYNIGLIFIISKFNNSLNNKVDENCPILKYISPLLINYRQFYNFVLATYNLLVFLN